MTGLLSRISLPAEGLWAFRRGLALLCLFDILERLTHASFFYSDLGIFPRNIYYLDPSHPGGMNLYLLSGQPMFVVSLLFLTQGLAILQLLGRSTPWRRGFLWALMSSIQFRFPGLMDSSDELLRLMLFWDIFLLKSDSSSRFDCVSWATIGLQVQVCAALLGIARHQFERPWALSAQWGGTRWAELWPGFSSIEVLVYIILAVAIWFVKTREIAIGLALPILFWRATAMHPVFPLTLAVGLMPFVRWRSWKAGPSLDSRAKVNTLCPPSQRTSLGGFVKSLLREPVLWVGLFSFFQGYGFREDWDRVYPLAEKETLQLTVRSSSEPRPLFQLESTDGRRLRLLSDALCENLGLTTPLGAAVSRKNGMTGADVWVKIDYNRADFRLGLPTIRMVTPNSTQQVIKSEGQ